MKVLTCYDEGSNMLYDNVITSANRSDIALLICSSML